MDLLRLTPAEYHAKWSAFNEAAEFLQLTPFDRNLAWREHTADEHWHELPVPISHFCHDPFYIGTDILVRPKIEEFIGDFWDFAGVYELFVFIGGLGSGKSFSASLSLCYCLYLLGCLRHPQKYFNEFPGISLSGDAEIVLMNASAAGQKQASKIVYGEVFEKVEKSPFFMQHYEPYPGRASELEFPNRVRLAPGTSQWQSALGWNLFGFVVDEAAFGIESERADYVKELFLALNQRRRSRFGKLGFGGLFTSPGSEHGFVEIIAGEGIGWDTTIMVRRISTWEAKDELQPGQRIFLLDRDPDHLKIVATDLIYLAPGKAQTTDGQLVTWHTLTDDERQARADMHAGLQDAA
jgi:hypothetical protein